MSVKRVVSILAALLLAMCSVVSITAVEPASANLEIIDISVWNGTINWSVAAKEVDGAIVRIGYRGSEYRDKIAKDTMFDTNMQGISQNNVPFGVYFYSYASTKAEAVEEANWVISTLKAGNYKPDLPIYIDVEAPELEGSLTNRERTDVVLSFCKTMKDNGYYAGVYASKYWLTQLLNSSEFEDYPVWVAQYYTTCTYTGRYEMWQYTNSGTFNGITGSVDVSHCYRDYSSFIRKCGYNGFKAGETPTSDTKDYSKRGTYKLTSALDVRVGKSDSYNSLGTIPKDSEVYVDYAVGDWGVIPYSNSVGWIKLGSSVSKTSKYMTTKSGIGYYTVNTDTLNVRKGPASTNDKIGELHSGETVFISGIEDGWGYYYGNGTKCWISLEFAKFYGTISFETNITDKYIQPVRLKTGTSTALSKWNISASGKNFSGWATTSSGAVAYADGATILMEKSNIVLYAKFNQDSYFSFRTSPMQFADNIAVISDQGLTESGFVNKYILPTSGYSYKMSFSDGSYVGSGSELSFIANGKVVGRITIVVAGDCSGDGVCNGIDLSDALNIYQGKSTIKYSDVQKKAADVNLDGKVDSTDINLIKKSAFGTADLSK